VPSQFFASKGRGKEDEEFKKKLKEDIEKLKPADKAFMTKERFDKPAFSASIYDRPDEPLKTDDPGYQREEKIETPGAASFMTDSECSTLYPDDLSKRKTMEKFSASKREKVGSQFRTPELSEEDTIVAPGEELAAQDEQLRKETEKRRAVLLREESKPNKNMFDLKSVEDLELLQVSNKKPIVVDFYKKGSETCRRLYPKLMDKFIDSKEEWSLVGANIDRLGELAKKYKIEDTPCVMVFHEGKVVETLKGEQSEKNLDSLIEKVNELARK